MIAESYRSGNISKTMVIKNLRYLDLLEKEYPEPITHLTEVSRQMTLERKDDEMKRRGVSKEHRTDRSCRWSSSWTRTGSR